MDGDESEQRPWSWSHEIGTPTQRLGNAGHSKSPRMPAVPGATGGTVLRSKIDGYLDHNTPLPASAPVTQRSPRSRNTWRYREASGALLPKQQGLFDPTVPQHTLQIDERSFARAALVKAEEVLQLDEQRLIAMHQKWEAAVKRTETNDSERESLTALLAERDKTIKALEKREAKKSKTHEDAVSERDSQIKELKVKACSFVS